MSGSVTPSLEGWGRAWRTGARQASAEWTVASALLTEFSSLLPAASAVWWFFLELFAIQLI